MKRVLFGTRRTAAAVGCSSVLVYTLFSVLTAHAQSPDEPKSKAPSRVWEPCTEVIPQGANRPAVIETFPERGVSGYTSNLVLTITHGKGETVMPAGFKVQASSEALKTLQTMGFAIPDQDGGSPAVVERRDQETNAVTTVTIPFVALPPDPGRTEMILPPMPIAVARASGDLMTLCTKPHAILVEDPTINEPDPKVKPNAPPRPQREEWVLAKQVTIGVLIGAVINAVAIYLYLKWRQKPKVKRLPPPKLPWIIALEELSAIRRSTLLADGKGDEYFDKVSDTVRKYLGARYGFDGLETTTDEMRSILRRVVPPIQNFGEIVRFLEDCDLVKFARAVPSNEDCTEALDRGELIVRTTVPPIEKRPAPPKEAA
ncbi:MAG: hypothetical protein IPK82_01970 [Polyangiaceae bacterium]|nr:hypothetical protein [Polyangiaceae bacterium]